MTTSYTYNGFFYGNILVVGRTECGKIRLVQKLAVNNFFGTLVKTEWVSYIKLDRAKEAEIQSCFNCHTEFVGRFQNQIMLTQQPKITMMLIPTLIVLLMIILEKKTKRDFLIVMDDVSGLADT